MKTNRKQPTKKETKKETIYPKGIVVFEPHEKAPDFVLADIIINKEMFIEFLKNTDKLQNHDKYGEQLKLVLKKGRENYYLEVNTFGLD